MRIHSLAIQHFPPFAEGSEIIFPAKPSGSTKAEVHLLVGANGSGKTRLLSLMCAALGNDRDLMERVGDMPGIIAAVAGESEAVSGVWTTTHRTVERRPGRPFKSALEWLKNGDGDIRSSQRTFVTKLSRTETGVSGPFALAFDARHTLEDCIVEPAKWRAVGEESSLVRLKLDPGDPEAITNNLAAICYYAFMDLGRAKGDKQVGKWAKIKSRMEDTLTTISGRTTYLDLAIDPETRLVVSWGDVPMFLTQLPDGFRSIMAWLGGCISKLCHVFKQHPNPLDIPFVLLIDEPESHLHPRWQRQIIHAAQSLFPNAQLIVATHSPFVISSVNEGYTHLLRVDDNSGESKPDKPRPCAKGDTYLEAINEVLGLTMNERFDPETQEELDEFDRLRSLVLAGEWQYEAALLDFADRLWRRESLVVEQKVGRDLYQVDLARKARSATNKENAVPKRRPARKGTPKAKVSA